MEPRVWAPDAAWVELALGERRHAMTHESTGWWSTDVTLAHGTDYAFCVDGGAPRPDPRSGWQPAGVHGPSRVFDADLHPWADAGWTGRDIRGAVMYELHVGTFTPQGTLAAAVEHLDHLVDLGVDVIELMPLASFSGTHGWGYDGVDLYSVHEAYGGPAGLQEFVDAAHARGLGVCLDVVHNHLGPSGNYLETFGPYFTAAHSTPWGAAINLDGPGSDEVRRWIIDSAVRWFREFHLDALRLDAVHELVPGYGRHVLAELSDEVAVLSTRLDRPLSLVAESDLNDPVAFTSTAQGGWGMTAQWADDVHHAIHALVTGERQGYYVDFGTPEVLRAALTRAFVHDGSWSTFRGKRWGHPVPTGTDGHRCVVFASNHDQVGNRATGDRPSASLDAGGLAIEAALVLLSPFTPMLFMGEEWGASTPWRYFTDHPEPELAEAVREGRRAEFQDHGRPGADGTEVPDPQDLATFAASRLDWSEPSEPAHARLLAWYRTLIGLRRSAPDLASGELAATSVQFEGGDPSDDDADGPSRPEGASEGWLGWIVVGRGTARVVLNLADEPREVPVTGPGPYTVRAAWEPVDVRAGSPAGTVVVVPARGVAVLVADDAAVSAPPAPAPSP